MKARAAKAAPARTLAGRAVGTDAPLVVALCEALPAVAEGVCVVTNVLPALVIVAVVGEGVLTEEVPEEKDPLEDEPVLVLVLPEAVVVARSGVQPQSRIRSVTSVQV